MPSEVRVFNPTTALHGGGVAMVSDLAGQVHADGVYGLFAGDTRVLSTYKFEVNGCAWDLLGRASLGHADAQWHFQNRMLRDAEGDIVAGDVAFMLTRRVDGVLHDDLEVTSFAQRPVRLRFIIQIDADFSDIFDVKDERPPPRMSMLRQLRDDGFALKYEREGFTRGLQIQITPKRPVSLVGSRLQFDLVLDHGEPWVTRLEAVPLLEVHVPTAPAAPPQRSTHQGKAFDDVRLDSIELITRPFERGLHDLRELALPPERAGDEPFVAAGVPWFLTLFGRDSLMPALMAGMAGSWIAEGALAALARHQADKRDDFRDAEPGKLPHELRRDERTHRGELPYSPYYGAHDVPALYCLALWQAWRWTGDRELVRRHCAAAARALSWCDTHGDSDGDGLQEYVTRSRKGYRNQGWKDAGDAIVDAAGCSAQPPLATVELQGYLYAARMAMAELMDACGETTQAQQQHEAARALRRRVEERYWMHEASFYALALDREKRRIDAVTSNPGHLLWCGLASRPRAAAVARRLLSPDMFSGWGLRTLSTRNPAYNPLSYQRGSVWPFDTLLAAAGLCRYGEREAAWVLIKGILDAASRFDADRLPELFGGFSRQHCGPVPYKQANAPQAWSAAAPLLAVQLILGLVPDAPRGCCYLHPVLPPWLPYLALDGVRVGGGTFRVALRRSGAGTVVERLEGDGIEVVLGEASAALHGLPLGEERMTEPPA